MEFMAFFRPGLKLNFGFTPSYHNQFCYFFVTFLEENKKVKHKDRVDDMKVKSQKKEEIFSCS